MKFLTTISLLFLVLNLSAQCWTAEPQKGDLIAGDTTIEKQYNARDGQNLFFFGDATVNLHLNKNNSVYVYKTLTLSNINVDHNTSTVYLAEGAHLIIDGQEITEDYHTKKGNSILHVERCEVKALPVKIDNFRLVDNTLRWDYYGNADYINVWASKDGQNYEIINKLDGNAKSFPIGQILAATCIVGAGLTRKRWLIGLALLTACTKEVVTQKQEYKYYLIEAVENGQSFFTKTITVK